MSQLIEFGQAYALHTYKVKLVNNRTINLYHCSNGQFYIHDLVSSGGVRIEIVSAQVIFYNTGTADPFDTDEITLVNNNSVQFLNEATGLILVGTDDLRYECINHLVQPKHWFDCSAGATYIESVRKENGNDVIKIYSPKGTSRFFQEVL